ncbi:uncharacterized protein LOC128182998 [Crassostrea angulata]|uniref:uncharacterized protein LOC128182998 n=1 Tax=Magallana angulata TaxID=2784310 RepID=UPI0022B0A0B2|nr:uncharacterized protein LOC128182998 [Crassostrea angulata]
MENILSLLIASVFLVTTKGQCPLNVGNKLLTTCSETTAYGPLIYIDFYKINRPCNCTVTSMFRGNLLVTAQKTRISSCSTQVVVKGSRIFGCPLSQITSVTFTLLQYQPFAVQAEFTPPSTSGNFYQCLGFQEKGGKGGDVSVLCKPSGTTTRTSYITSPTRKTTSSLTSTTRKTTSLLTSTTRKTTSPLTSTTRKTTSPLTSTTRKTNSLVTSTRTTARKTSSTLTPPTRKTTSTLTPPTRKTTSTVTTTTTTRKTAFPLISTRKTTSPSTSTKTTATTRNIKRYPPSSTYIVLSAKSTSGLTDTRNNTTDNHMSFVSTVSVPYTLSMEPIQDDQNEMIYFIAGSAAGGVMLLIGLVVFVILKINRERNGNAIVENKKEDSARTNEVFDYNNELTENPLYVTSQPEEEVGNTSGENLKLGLPVMDSKTMRKNNPDYDVPPNNKPIDSIPVYAVPNKNKTLHHVINNGDVYAQVKK